MGSPSHQLLASMLLPRFPPKGLSFESSWWLYEADGNRFQTCRRGGTVAWDSGWWPRQPLQWLVSSLGVSCVELAEAWGLFSGCSCLPGRRQSEHWDIGT